MASNKPISRKKIEGLIRDFITESPENNMNDESGNPAWRYLICVMI